MTAEQAARGSDKEYCSVWPADGHHMSTHMKGGAAVTVSRCNHCGWIDFDDLDEQVRKLTSNEA